MGRFPVEQINAEEAEAAVRVKGEKGSQRSHVTLRVQGDGEECDVYYRFKTDFPLHHLKLDYCNRLGNQYGAVRFIFNGTSLSGAKTPNDLRMNNGDVILAWIDKTGG